VSDSKEPAVRTQHDEIDVVMRQTGVNTPDLDRLARLINDMQHLEWQLARRCGCAEAPPK
jgi:hypothetical protein